MESNREDMTYFEEAKDWVLRIENELAASSYDGYSFQTQVQRDYFTLLQKLLDRHLKNLSPNLASRIREEFQGWGPIQPLIEDPDVTEIMINSSSDIWYEKDGRLYQCHDHFVHERSYQFFLDRLLNQASRVVTKDHPIAEGHVRGFRLHYVGEDLTKGSAKVCLRRLGFHQFQLQSMVESGWCSEEALLILRQMLDCKENFLVVGGTGTGKTSLLSALLAAVQPEERVAIIEDTDELPIPNSVSFKLLTRSGGVGDLREYDQMALLKNVLRMRPDRIIVGEMRGGEAKDFLMALSTGHGGSGGSLHAESAQQALSRLEMMVQMGAPFWNPQTVRKLIHQSLQKIIVVGRDFQGRRFLKGIYEVSSLEECGFTLETCYRGDGYRSGFG